MNTSDTVNRGRTTSNALQTSFYKVTPVAGTRRQQSPMTNFSNGKFSNIKYC